jgi:hypothetical protein
MNKKGEIKRMSHFRVTVFEKQTYEIDAKNQSDAIDKVLSGYVNKIDEELDGIDAEEIK